MVRREVLRTVGPAQNLTLTPRGDRVTTVLAVAPAGDDDASPTLLVANTHLSFDHGKLWDKRLRRLQAEALTAALHVRDTELAVPTVAYLLAGDLNGDRQEQVYGHLKKEGYWDSSAAVGEAGGSGRTWSGTVVGGRPWDESGDPSAIPLRSLCDPLTGSDRHQPLPTGSDRVPTASDRSRPPQTESGNEIGYRAHR